MVATVIVTGIPKDKIKLNHNHSGTQKRDTTRSLPIRFVTILERDFQY
ncbi:MAG: hypothetical protein V3T67_02380 [Nitrosopumilaceae archaeon]